MKVDERPSKEEIDKIVEYSYTRYFKTGALFGTVSDASSVVSSAIEIGVNEIACLVDFGVSHELILRCLPYLNKLKNIFELNTNSSEMDSKNVIKSK